MTTPAFPGAYGWGAEAIGGRGGAVKVVSSLANSGAGSLRAALQATGARIVVFTIAGELELTSPLTITNPNITIAGQTAPGNGVYVTGERINIQTSQIIIRYLKYRGNLTAPARGFFAFRPFSGPVNNVIIDHCSGAWSPDDMIDMWHEGAVSGYQGNQFYNITIQNCLFTEPDDGHATLAMFRGDYLNGGKNLIHHISYLNNLHTNTGYRNPFVCSQHTEVVNNVIYNQHWYGIGIGDEAEVDIINNYMKPGPLDGKVNFNRDNEYGDNPMSIYIEGNILQGVLAAGDDNWPYVGNEFSPWGNPSEATHRRTIPLSSPVYPYSPISADTAYNLVLEEAGACRRLNADGSWTWNRDTLDERIVDEVKNDTGPSTEITNPSTQVPPIVIAGTAYTDTDGDGIPDDWELANGLDPADAVDGSLIGSSGYSNVELFLNGPQEVQMSVITDLQAVEAALRQEALDIVAQADAVAQAVVDLQAVDDALDAAADVIEVD